MTKKQLLYSKFSGMFIRLVDVFRLLPERFLRLVSHIFSFKNYMFFGDPTSKHPEFNKGVLVNISMWLIEFMIYILEIFGIGEMYETMSDFIKFNTRPLLDWEIKLAQSVFKDTINYKRVRLDEKAFLGPKQMRLAYVGFYTINVWGNMRNSHLIHEMTHIYQYEKMGAVYMPRAVAAQASPNGYNYGGVERLKAFQLEQKTFHDFNLEQQGDIVADYYRLREGYEPQWGQGRATDLGIYESFIEQIS